MHTLTRSQVVPRPLDEVFDFFSNAANLETLTPSFLKFRILTPMPVVMGAGTLIDYRLSLFGIPQRWRTRITVWQSGVRFVDEQESGPYRLWRHTHEFEARGSSTVIRDTVDYLEPFGLLGQLAHHLVIKHVLNRIFDFRRDAVARVFAAPGRS